MPDGHRTQCIIYAVRLLLASASPRRADLLAAAGFAFDVQPVEVDETPRVGEEPDEYVRRLAVEKAEAANCRASGSPVIGADTTVVLDGRILGKPIDEREAAEMLQFLSGRVHEVLTGVAVVYGGRRASFVDRTRVHFLHLSEADRRWYLASGEWRDKAGAYAVQGRAARFIPRLEGSYTNVVGLPVAALDRLLREVGVPDGFGAPARD